MNEDQLHFIAEPGKSPRIERRRDDTIRYVSVFSEQGAIEPGTVSWRTLLDLSMDDKGVETRNTFRILVMLLVPAANPRNPVHSATLCGRPEWKGGTSAPTLEATQLGKKLTAAIGATPEGALLARGGGKRGPRCPFGRGRATRRARWCARGGAALLTNLLGPD